MSPTDNFNQLTFDQHIIHLFNKNLFTHYNITNILRNTKE